LKAPIVSPILSKTNYAYTARTLGSLIGAGVPLLRSLEIMARTLPNIYFKEAMLETAEKVRKGGTLAQALSAYPRLYSPLFTEMLKVGEETGKTSEILEKLAEFFEEEVNNATKNLASVVEPVLMIIIGALVGFFAVSMIQPMYSMLGTL
jgi:type IV pilus assembly protein PilC